MCLFMFLWKRKWALNFALEGAQTFSSGKGHFYKERINLCWDFAKGITAKTKPVHASKKYMCFTILYAFKILPMVRWCIYQLYKTTAPVISMRFRVCTCVFVLCGHTFKPSYHYNLSIILWCTLEFLWGLFWQDHTCSLFKTILSRLHSSCILYVL